METTKQRPKDVVINNVLVKNIQDGSDYFDDRVFIELDCEPFDSFNGKGEAVKDTNFGINARRLQQEVAPFSSEIMIADAFSNGEPIDIAIHRLATRFGTISIKREYKFKGEVREDVPSVNGVPQVYENDCWRTTITGFTPNAEMLAKVSPILYGVNGNGGLLQNPKKKEKKQITNPRNV